MNTFDQRDTSGKGTARYLGCHHSITVFVNAIKLALDIAHLSSLNNDECD